MHISKCTFTSNLMSKNISDMQINSNFDNSVHVKHTCTKLAEVAGIACFTIKR